MIIDEGIKNKSKFLNVKPFSKDEAAAAMDYVVKKTDENIADFTDCFPSSASKELMYEKTENIDWTNGFFTGLLWLCYEYTGNPKFLKTAEIQCKSFKNRIDKKIAVDHHDMGFLYSPSCVAGYNITKNEEMKNSAWARGQAWGISGFSIAYRYTKIPDFTDTCCKIANFFMNRLPDDYIPYWDLVFSDTSNQERDSSAAAIAVNGLIELSMQSESNYRPFYKGAISAMLHSG